MAASFDLNHRRRLILPLLAGMGLVLLLLCSIGAVLTTLLDPPSPLINSAAYLGAGMVLLAAPMTMVYIGMHVLVAVRNYLLIKQPRSRLPLVETAVIFARVCLFLWVVPTVMLGVSVPGASVADRRPLILSLSMVTVPPLVLLAFTILHETIERPFELPGTVSRPNMTCRVSDLLRADLGHVTAPRQRRVLVPESNGDALPDTALMADTLTGADDGPHPPVPARVRPASEMYHPATVQDVQDIECGVRDAPRPAGPQKPPLGPARHRASRALAPVPEMGAPSRIRVVGPRDPPPSSDRSGKPAAAVASEERTVGGQVDGAGNRPYSSQRLTMGAKMEERGRGQIPELRISPPQPDGLEEDLAPLHLPGAFV